jgi:multidrug efflux pump subunit AcrA (membrane-fusion protein)
MTAPVPAPGIAVDATGGPVIDPTQNVLDLVKAAITRQDDLRAMESAHLREVMSLRAEYDQRLRDAETARINAIRAVDVGAVNRAAEVSSQQANTLAAQVAQSAETLRTQVATAAAAASTALAAALDPIQRDIADLRRVQYETQGGKSNVVETREARGDARLNVNTLIMSASLLIAVLVFVLNR